MITPSHFGLKIIQQKIYVNQILSKKTYAFKKRKEIKKIEYQVS